MDIQEIVTERLSDERALANQAVNKALADGIAREEISIADVVPELIQARVWGNLPHGILPSDFLLCGPTPVIDLEARLTQSPAEFESNYGFDLSTAEELARQQLVWLNIYTRDPVAWVGLDHMSNLLKAAHSQYDRVVTFLELRRPGFEKQIARRRAQLEPHVQAFKEAHSRDLQALAKSSRLTSVDEFPQVVGTQWAYLDVLAPDKAQHVESLVNEGDLAAARDFAVLAKHLHVSPITAALGGQFAFGPIDLKRFARMEDRNREALTRGSGSTERPLICENPELLRFLRVHCQAYRGMKLGRVESGKLLSIMTETNLPELKRMLAEASELIAGIVARGTMTAAEERQIRDWRGYQEIVDGIRTHQAFLSAAVESTISISFGVITDKLLGYLPEGLIEIPTPVSRPLRKRVLTHFCPEHHRLYCLMEDIEALLSTEGRSRAS